MATKTRVEDNDFGWKRIQRELKAADGVFTKVGLPAEGAVGGRPAGSMSEVATVGAVHEFGAPKRNIPERSFLRSTFDENKQNLRQRKAVEYDRIMLGKQTAKQAIGRIGEWLTTRVKKKIRDIKSPPNAAATILRKGSSNPLIDTGQMVQSVTHVEFTR